VLVNCRPEGSNAIHGFPSSPSLTVNLKSARSVVILVLLFTLSHCHTSTGWIILSWNRLLCDSDPVGGCIPNFRRTRSPFSAILLRILRTAECEKCDCDIPGRAVTLSSCSVTLLGVSGSLASRKTSSNCSRSAEWRTVAASPRIVHRQVFLLNSTATLARTVARRRLADFERVAAEIVAVQLDQIEGVQEHAGVVSAVTDALEARHSIVDSPE
jgi:hypothetical protein